MNTGTKIAVIVGAAMIPILAVIGFNLSGRLGAPEPDPYATVDWKMLRQFDLETGAVGSELARFDGQKVKVPGFVVPLEDDDEGLAEFLLVPSPQACIHVPPPPANQMLLVQMDGGAPPKREWGAVWIKGILRITEGGTQYGKTSFRLYGEGAVPYTRGSE